MATLKTMALPDGDPQIYVGQAAPPDLSYPGGDGDVKKNLIKVFTNLDKKVIKDAWYNVIEDIDQFQIFLTVNVYPTEGGKSLSLDLGARKGTKAKCRIKIHILYEE